MVSCCKLTECDAWNMFTIVVYCIDDTNIEQKDPLRLSVVYVFVSYVGFSLHLKASKKVAATAVQSEAQKHVQRRDDTKTRPRPGFMTLCCFILYYFMSPCCLVDLCCYGCSSFGSFQFSENKIYHSSYFVSFH